MRYNKRTADGCGYGMTTVAPISVPTFVPAALAASQVGTWETNSRADRTITDATTAALFGVDPARAANGLPLAAYARAIHPEDVLAFSHKLDDVRTHGGLFVVEYRTCPHPGLTHWVLARGRYERDGWTGEMIGRGIVIDISESKLDGQGEDRALFVKPDVDASPLDRAADHVIEARRAIDAVGGSEWPALRKAVDDLLWTVGRALARQAHRGTPDSMF